MPFPQESIDWAATLAFPVHTDLRFRNLEFLNLLNKSSNTPIREHTCKHLHLEQSNFLGNIIL